MLVPGVLCCFLCEAISMNPTGTHLSLLTCHHIWFIPWEGTVESSPCLVCPDGNNSALGVAQCPSGLTGSDSGLSRGFAPLGSCFFLVPHVLPPQRRVGKAEQRWHWELHHAMLMPGGLSLPMFWSSSHHFSVITFYFENFEGWGEEFIFWYSGTSK